MLYEAILILFYTRIIIIRCIRNLTNISSVAISIVVYR